jgi:hypothetical protein
VIQRLIVLLGVVCLCGLRAACTTRPPDDTSPPDAVQLQGAGATQFLAAAVDFGARDASLNDMKKSWWSSFRTLSLCTRRFMGLTPCLRGVYGFTSCT